MDWKELKALLVNGHFDLEITTPGGVLGRKVVNLTMDGGALAFTSLGAGTNKRVVRVNGENWVLALAGDSSTAAKDVREEAETLAKLALRGVKVPEPFKTGQLSEILFTVRVYNQDIGDERTYAAFLQQFLPYQEMDKKQPKEKFAKDKIVTGNKVPPKIQTTVDDLQKILNYFKTVAEWGDFQVMYNNITGDCFTFDPLPTNQSGSSYTKLVQGWLNDIQFARDLERAKTAGRDDLGVANKATPFVKPPGRDRRGSF